MCVGDAYCWRGISFLRCFHNFRLAGSTRSEKISPTMEVFIRPTERTGIFWRRTAPRGSYRVSKTTPPINSSSWHTEVWANFSICFYIIRHFETNLYCASMSLLFLFAFRITFIITNTDYQQTCLPLALQVVELQHFLFCHYIFSAVSLKRKQQLMVFELVLSSQWETLKLG